MIICPTVQRPLSPLVYALDLKSRAFWFFIFTDEKGTPVKIGTTYSLCLNDKKKKKSEGGKRQAGRGTRWTRPRGGRILFRAMILSRKGMPPFFFLGTRARAAPFVYICTKQIGTHVQIHIHIHTYTYTYTTCKRKGSGCRKLCRGERSAR